MSDSEILPGGAPPSPPNSWNPVAAANFPPGTPLYVPAANEVGKAKADAAATASCVGVAMNIGDVGKRVFARYAGLLTLTAAEWAAVIDIGGVPTVGVPYYVSNATAGKLTKTLPGSGFVTQVGIFTSNVGLLIQPSVALAAGVAP